MAAREEIIRGVMSEVAAFDVDESGVTIRVIADITLLKRLLTLAENRGGEATLRGSLRIGFPVSPPAPEPIP